MQKHTNKKLGKNEYQRNLEGNSILHKSSLTTGFANSLEIIERKNTILMKKNEYDNQVFQFKEILNKST